MAAQLAECYMLILRPVPVLGEVWAKPFNGQIYIDEWDWTLTPKAHQEGAAPAPPAGAQAGGAGAPAPQPREGGGTPEGARGAPQRPEPFDGRSLAEEVSRLMRATEVPLQRDRRVRDLIARRADEYNRAAGAAPGSAGSGHSGSHEEGRHDGLEFNFKKSTDLASSQMLYLLANNDLIPTVILTVFQRANSFPLTLIITMVNVRFTSCKLSAEPGETMTEIMEAWAGTYEHISYAYHNRPPVGLPTSPFAALTQGRVKAFIMNPRGGGGLPV